MIESIAETNESAKNDEYPKLMINDFGCIALFTEPQKGTIVHAPQGKIGNYHEHWNLERFQDFHGKVTLISK